MPQKRLFLTQEGFDRPAHTRTHYNRDLTQIKIYVTKTPQISLLSTLTTENIKHHIPSEGAQERTNLHAQLPWKGFMSWSVKEEEERENS